MSDDDELNELMLSDCRGEDCGEGGYDTTEVKHKSVEECPPGTPPTERGSTQRNVVQWSTSDNQLFIPTCRTIPTLPPGYYEANSCPNIGFYFEKIKVNHEGLLRFPDAQSERVIEEIDKFWEKEEMFRNYKLAYKRGILLWGPPGSGKSCTIQIICHDLITKRKGIIVKWTDPKLLLGCVRPLKEIQPKVPLIILMEDLDGILKEQNESKVLNVLDGVDKIDKAVFLATTNYPERLGPRIVNRPSRFDKRFKIGVPNAASRKMYFEHLVSENGCQVDIDKWVTDTEDLSIAHLKELFVAVNILDDPYDEALETVRSMRDRTGFDSDDDHRSYHGGNDGIGFGTKSGRS